MTVTINGTSGITTPGVNSTGSNVLGDNVADTLNVGNGAIVTNSSGNVGIGTSSPTDKLHVIGNAKLGSAGYISFLNAANDYSAWINNSASGGDGNLTFYVGGTATAKMLSSHNFQFNSGYGSVATAYGCRAWVNFNGTGTVAIRGSGNVSSISDFGTGYYGVNFSSAMPDTNYTVAASSCNDAYVTSSSGYNTAISATPYNENTGTVVTMFNSTTGLNDAAAVLLVYFR